jgi:hypothetical protein
MGARLIGEKLGACEFAASTRWGQIHLAIPLSTMSLSGAAVPDALVQAMCLSQADALVAELESWCEQPLPFRPVPCGLGHEVANVLAPVCDARLAPTGSELRVPLGLLKRHSPKASLQSPSVLWPQWPFEVTLAELDDELVSSASVHVGDMVLLPEAFQCTWRVKIQDASGHCHLHGLLEMGEACIESIVPSDAARTDKPWRVQLARPVSMDMPTALGWHDNDLALPLESVSGAGGQLDFGIHAELHHRQRGLVLSGLVVPVLLGAALWVRALHQSI